MPVLAFQPGTHMLGIVTDKRLVVFDPLSGQELLNQRLPVRSTIISGKACAWSREGRFIAASLNNGLLVADMRDKALLVNDAMPMPFRAIGALAFTPDAQALIVGGQMRSVCVLDLASKKVVRIFPTLRHSAGIAVLPDDSTVAVCGFGGIDLWNLSSGQRCGSLPGCKSYGSRLLLAGRYLLAGCGAHVVQIWDANTKGFLGAIKGHPFIAQQFSASVDAGILLAGSGPGAPDNPQGFTTSEILLIDIANQKTLASWRSHSAGGIYETAISSDGMLLATCGYDGLIKLWTLEK